MEVFFYSCIPVFLMEVFHVSDGGMNVGTALCCVSYGYMRF